MRLNLYGMIAVLPLAVLVGCNARLPNTYGIYADTNHSQVELHEQTVQRAGNLMSFYAGLPGPSGIECTHVKDFVVFEKDVDPSSVHLVKLVFLQSGEVGGIPMFGPSKTNINLWVPDKTQIDLDVQPIQAHPDMYIMKPHSPLENGFYALSIGQFGGQGFNAGVAFDLVVGSISDYPSYAQALDSARLKIAKVAPDLLARINEMTNSADYRDLSKVYRPGGQILSGPGLQAFADGNQTWISNSGKIVKSEVMKITANSETSATCVVKTTYEKVGVQNEEVTIGKIGDDYYIIGLK